MGPEEAAGLAMTAKILPFTKRPVRSVPTSPARPGLFYLCAMLVAMVVVALLTKQLLRGR